MQNSNLERLRFAAELINDFVVDWNLNTDEVYLSSRWKQMLGYTDEEIPNNFAGWLMTVEPDYRETFIAALFALREGKIPVSFIERKAVCKDGSFIWIASKAKVVDWNPDGRASRIIGVFSNINEKKLAEEMLAEEHFRYASIIDTSADLIFNLDDQYRLLAANHIFLKSAKKITGTAYTAGDDLSGFVQQLNKYVHCRELFEKCLQGERLAGEYHFDVPELQLDKWIEYSVLPLLDSKGKKTIVVRVKDISEKVKAADLLQLEKDNFKTILKSLPDLIFRLDSANRFIYYHTNQTEDLLLPAEAFIGRPLSAIIPNPLLGILEDKIAEAHISGNVVKCEYSLEIPQQGTCWFEARISSTIDHHTIAVIRNITQAIQSAEALKNSRRFYEFTSKVNDLILYATEETALFSQVTRIAVEDGGFLFSFIGGMDSDGKTFGIKAQAGYEAGYLAILQSKFSPEVPDERNGPAGKALREGKHFICDDIEHDSQMLIWRDEALKRGYRSSIALPIIPDQKAEFVFTLYADKPFSISGEELLLLDRVAANISFALKNLRNSKKKTETEMQLKIITQAVEQNSASVVITDIEGNIEYVNPAFCTLSGYSFEEAIGQNPRILKSGYTTSDEYKQLWNRLVHHQTWSGVFCNKRKDGSFYWESAVISPILNEAGDITHYVSVKENITAQKKLEEELKEKIRIIEVAQNVAQIGTYIIDLKTRTWESSAIFDQIFGLDAMFEKQMDQFYALVLPEYLKGMDAQSVLAQQHKKSFTYKFKAKRRGDGQIRCLESYAIFIYDDEGIPIQLIGAMKDITEIEELIEERERILESINDYFYVLDRQMNFKYCNQAFANRYLKGSKEAVIGINLYALFPVLDQSELAEHLTNAIASGISDHFEIYLDYKEINVGWFEEHMYPFENGISVLFRDISYRKETEENLRKLNMALNLKTQELTNTNTELERFAYVASHDLQEPLRMVSSFMQLFEQKYKDIVDETGKQYIHFAVDGAERMKTMIRDLLQYSRAGSGSLEITQVDMNVVLKEVLLLFKNEIYQVDADIKFEHLPVIKAGKSAMIQLMQNLIENALKYRGKENPVVEISGEETEQEWMIHVKDNGIGIDPKYFEKIFIVFQRLHNKDAYSGTGIGLSICKKIVEQYKGKIWLVSEPGKGSVFSFSIPKKRG